MDGRAPPLGHVVLVVQARGHPPLHERLQHTVLVPPHQLLQVVEQLQPAVDALRQDHRRDHRLHLVRALLRLRHRARRGLLLGGLLGGRVLRDLDGVLLDVPRDELHVGIALVQHVRLDLQHAQVDVEVAVKAVLLIRCLARGTPVVGVRARHFARGLRRLAAQIRQCGHGVLRLVVADDGADHLVHHVAHARELRLALQRLLRQRHGGQCEQLAARHSGRGWQGQAPL